MGLNLAPKAGFHLLLTKFLSTKTVQTNPFAPRLMPTLVNDHQLRQLNPILDGVWDTPIMDGGGAKSPSVLTLPFGV